MSIHRIPVNKAGKKLIEVDSSEAGMSAEVYNAIFEIGLKHVVNLGMSGLYLRDFASPAEYEAAAWAIAEKQVEKIKSGKVTGVSKSKAPSKRSGEYTEALRLAKIVVKSDLKAAGTSVGRVKAADITAAAEAYIAADLETWLAVGRNSLAAVSAPKSTINVAELVKEDPKLKAKAEKAKAASKAKPKAPAVAAKPKAKGAAKHA